MGLSACIKEPQSNNSNKPSLNAAPVAVLCEGNFMWNNAQLDIFNPDSDSLWSRAFESVNQRPLGDVLQSGLVYGNTLWLVVNNSGKLLGLNSKTCKLQQQIEISKSPRFALAHQGKLYVTDIESNAITILDTATRNTQKIQVLPNPNGIRSGWTENIVTFNNKIVAAVYDGFLWVYDPISQEKTLVSSPKGTQLLSVDKQNRLWVGGSEADSSFMHALNANLEVTQRISFPKGNNLSRMCLSATRDTMWLLLGGNLQARDLQKPQIPINKIVPYTTGYGLGVNPQNGDIYISDAYDFISRGRVAVLNAGADSVKTSFFTGINPGAFVFLGN